MILLAQSVVKEDAVQIDRKKKLDSYFKIRTKRRTEDKVILQT